MSDFKEIKKEKISGFSKENLDIVSKNSIYRAVLKMIEHEGGGELTFSDAQRKLTDFFVMFSSQKAVDVAFRPRNKIQRIAMMMINDFGNDVVENLENIEMFERTQFEQDLIDQTITNLVYASLLGVDLDREITQIINSFDLYFEDGS